MYSFQSDENFDMYFNSITCKLQSVLHESEGEVDYSSLSGDGVEDVLEPDVPLAHRQRPAPRVHDARHVTAARGRGGTGGKII